MVNNTSETANPIMKYFDYQHLPPTLAEVSKEFHNLAWDMEKNIRNSAEKSAGLRKLLEAKDCFVRVSKE